MSASDREDGQWWAAGASRVDGDISWSAPLQPFHPLLRGDAAVRLAVAAVVSLVVVGVAVAAVGPALLQLGAGAPDIVGDGGGPVNGPGSNASATPTSDGSPSDSPPENGSPTDGSPTESPTSSPSPSPTESSSPTPTEGFFDDGNETESQTEQQTRTQSEQSPTPTDECEGICFSSSGVGAIGLPWTLVVGLTFVIWVRR